MTKKNKHNYTQFETDTEYRLALDKALKALAQSMGAYGSVESYEFPEEEAHIQKRVTLEDRAWNAILMGTHADLSRMLELGADPNYSKSAVSLELLAEYHGRTDLKSLIKAYQNVDNALSSKPLQPTKKQGK